jgi:hypothetical protein
MILRQVMQRLTHQASPPLRLVAGLAEFAVLQAPPGDGAMPAAFVVPIGTEAGRNGLAAGGFRQRLEESFAVILLHRNKRDPRGEQAALDLADHLIPAVRAALIAWQPMPEWEPVELRRSALLDMDDGVVAWREDYATAIQHRVL